MNVTEVIPAAPPQSSLRKGVSSAPGDGSTNYLEGFSISFEFRISARLGRWSHYSPAYGLEVYPRVFAYPLIEIIASKLYS